MERTTAHGFSSRITAHGFSSRKIAHGFSSRIIACGFSSRITAHGFSSRKIAHGFSSRITAHGFSSRIIACGFSSRITAHGFSRGKAKIEFVFFRIRIGQPLRGLERPPLKCKNARGSDFACRAMGRAAARPDHTLGQLDAQQLDAQQRVPTLTFRRAIPNPYYLIPIT